MSYVVKAPLIIVTNPENGDRDAYLYQGAPVPSFVSEERLASLEADDLIEKAAEAADSKPAKSGGKSA